MYRETTAWQVGRAVGVWLFGFGVFLIPTLVIQLNRVTSPGVASFAALMLVGGGLVYFGSLWGLRRADAANRPALMAPDGHRFMRGREEFEQRVSLIRRWVLGGFLVTGTAYLFSISQHSCGHHTRGVCGWPRLDLDLMSGLQVATISMGAAYLALSVLRIVHARESERLSDIIAEGRRQRRGDDPFAGTRRDGWDFD